MSNLPTRVTQSRVTQSETFSLSTATIADVNRAFQSGELTSHELTQLYLNRIHAYDSNGPELNSVAVLNPDALEDAADLDALRRAGFVLGPLHGVPVLVKDSFNVKGLPTSNGVEALKPLIAAEDAFAVKQLRDAGAVILGKTNMSTWAFSYDGISESYGPVINPYAPDRTPGGSSSGSGAAIAANLAMFAMGGETGGSIRVPSTHNALVGIKPSAGLISVDGTWPLTPERDAIGPMAKSVTDIAYAMDALVAYDPNNIWNPYIPNVEKARPFTYTSYLDEYALEGKVLGIPRPYVGQGDPANGESFPIDPEVLAAFENAKDFLEAQGATLVEVDIPAHKTWFTEFPPEGYPESSAERIAQTRAYYYEHIIKGYNNPEISSFVDLLDLIPQDNPNYEYVAGIANTISEGDAKPWSEVPEVDQALTAIAELRTNEYENFMSENGIDAFVFPTLNYLAPPQGEGADEVYSLYGALPARFEANILGVPAVTVPMGYSTEGIPMSLEFMGNYFGEAEILGYAYDYEQATKLRRLPDLTPPLPGEAFRYEISLGERKTV
ncbi:amidase [Leptolyngbya sp. AN03gr2]|uniref:amidase n=1 Tax=unclassified Leptolyngbya TaxID=2650499 RepID=UPI003D317CCE